MATFTEMEQKAREKLADAVRASGLIEPGSGGVALLSGGPDSACLAAGLAIWMAAGNTSASRPAPPGWVVGLHLNYGLRVDSGEDEETCRELCERLGIELVVEAVELEPGNVQARAREARYSAAERLRVSRGGDWIATGHTRTDLAETVLYRLASSPGRRALLGLRPRKGRVLRPLLALGRDQTRSLAGVLGLPFRDDPSNTDPGFARVRLRTEVLPVLRDLSPAAEANIAATWAELAEEAEALEALAAEALAAAGAGGEETFVQASGLDGLPAPLRRLALRQLAERTAGREVPLGRDRAEQIWRLAGTGEGGEVELGGSLSAICEAGVIRFANGPSVEDVVEPAALPVPGECRWGRWRLQAELLAAPVDPEGPEIATLDATRLGPRLEVRGWRQSDRMRPLGLAGTKTLQDLFTDRHVPRSLRHELPVVTAGGRIAWVAGVAVGEEFRLGEATERAAVLTASRVD